MIDDPSNPPAPAGDAPPTDATDLAAAAGTAPLLPGWTRRFRGGSNFSPLALVIAIAVHAALIGAGFYFYESVQSDEPPTLVLPKGWATDQDGSADPGAAARMREAPPVTFVRAVGGDGPVAAPSLLGAPPAEFEPPDVRETSRAIDPSRGTKEPGPLLGLPSHAGTPVIQDNRPPATGSPPPEAPVNPGASGATGTQTVATAHRLSDAADAADAAVGSNGASGIPEGEPIPSDRNRVPRYPQGAFDQGWGGTATLELDISARGKVTGVRLLKSTGHDILDQEAVDCARSWQFTPAKQNGRSIAVTRVRNVNFLPPPPADARG